MRRADGAREWRVLDDQRHLMIAGEGAAIEVAEPTMAMAPSLLTALVWRNPARCRYAGMSEYALGEHAAAQRDLQRFLELYRNDDGWAHNARTVLERLGEAP